MADAPLQAASVEDARALRLADGRLVRLAGIEPFTLLSIDADQADAAMRNRLQTLVAGKPVQVRLLSAAGDRYGRLPALLAAANGVTLQTVLAAEGLAIAFATGEPIPCFAAILAAEAEAAQSKRGFWARASVLRATPKSLAGRNGGFAIFDGRVLTVGNRRTHTYLNFGSRWATDVTVDIEAKDRDAFGGETALGALAGQRVRVRGYVEERSGPLVRVRSPMQIQMLGGAAATEE
jgi:hypothetical protein